MGEKLASKAEVEEMEEMMEMKQEAIEEVQEQIQEQVKKKIKEMKDEKEQLKKDNADLLQRNTRKDLAIIDLTSQIENLNNYGEWVDYQLTYLDWFKNMSTCSRCLEVIDTRYDFYFVVYFPCGHKICNNCEETRVTRFITRCNFCNQTISNAMRLLD